MFKYLLPALVLCFLFACGSSSSKKSHTIDIIIVNGDGKSEIMYDGAELKNSDSLRIITSEITSVAATRKGFDLTDITIFPGTSMHMKNGVEKYYITLDSEKSGSDLEHHENQRYLEDFGQHMEIEEHKCYGYKNEETFYVEVNDKVNGELANSGEYETFRYKEVMKGLNHNVYTYLERIYTFSNSENPNVFEHPEDVYSKLLIDDYRLVSVEGNDATLQLRGRWQLLNSHDDVLYQHPFRTTSSTAFFEPVDFHGRYLYGSFRESGSSEMVARALIATYKDFFFAEKTQRFLDKKDPLFKKHWKTGKDLPEIAIQNKTGKSGLENALNATVYVTDEEENSFGSGSIISTDGYILTNYHVINEMNEIWVTLNSGKELEAELIRVDMENDVALLKINGSGYPCIPIHLADDFAIGDRVFSIGTPIEFEHFNTVLEGSVSRRKYIYDKLYIQQTGLTKYGMSGGPLVNAKGQQIGVQEMVLLDGDGVIHPGFSFDITIKNAFEALHLVLR